MEVVEWIDKNNVKEKQDSRYYRNALKIKLWMEQKQTSTPPKTTGDREEYLLAIKLSEIRRELIKPYNELKREEEKEKYMSNHPELEDVIKIIELIDENNIRAKEDSVYYKNALEIKKWVEENQRYPKYNRSVNMRNHY